MAENMFPHGIANLLDSETLSDLTIRCGDRKWHAHKAIVCSQSQVLFKACSGSFMEAKIGEIELKEDDPDTIHALLTYLYVGGYDEVKTANGNSRQLFNVRVFAAAEKYFVAPLLQLARDKFSTALTATPFDQNSFKDAILEWSISAIDTHKMLGYPILNYILEHRADIYKSILPSPLKQIISEVPWLAGKLNEGLVKGAIDTCNNKAIAKTYLCSSCRNGIFVLTSEVASKLQKNTACPHCNVVNVFSGQGNGASGNLYHGGAREIQAHQVAYIMTKPQ